MKVNVPCPRCNNTRFITKPNIAAAKKRLCRSCGQKETKLIRTPPSRKGIHCGVGYVGSDGYRMISVGPRKYQREHRLVMEAHIGRKLKATEVVHHINGDKLDNRIENLYLCTTESKHRGIHKSFERVVKPLIEKGVVKFNFSTGEYQLSESN